MGDEQKPKLSLDGLHVGDMVLRPVPSFGTDSHLDTPASRERTRQQEEDARVAQHAGNAPAPAAEPILPLGQGGAVDASIQAAREALEGEGPDDVPLPILLRDPVTGKVIGSV